MLYLISLHVRTLNRNEPVVGRLALYVMALKSSCDDLHNASLTVGEKSQPLLTHLKKQLELEKEHIACELILLFFLFLLLLVSDIQYIY